MFRYAIATGRADRDPSRDLSGALAPIQERHFASITEPLAVGVQLIVPLSTQAVAILRELQPLTGRFPFAFPSVRSRFRAMSENAITGALRRMGYTGQDMTGHGFRSMASMLLNEHGWNRDAIERQLAHGERDAVRAAYNYAEHLPEGVA